jgi:hypothetical protein
LCQSCHNTEGHFYSFTGHAREGLLCTDCHLTIAASPGVGEPEHGRRTHTFKVDLAACNACHLDDMHAEAEETDAEVITAAAEPDVVAVVEAAPPAAPTLPSPPAPPATSVPVAADVSPTPHGPSPLVYILPAGFGLVFGMLLAPWVDRLSGRRRKNGEKEG